MLRSVIPDFRASYGSKRPDPPWEMNRDSSQSVGLILWCPPYIAPSGSTVLRDLSDSRKDGTFSGASYGAGNGGPGQEGQVLIHDNVNDEVSFGPADEIPLPTQVCTVALWYRKRDGTNRNSGAFGFDEDPLDTPIRCSSHLPYGNGTVFWDFGGISEGTNRLSVASLTVTGNNHWVFTTGPRGMEIWQNGDRVGDNNANPTRTTTSDDFTLGNHFDVSDLADYGEFRLYKRQLAESECHQLWAPTHRWELMHSVGRKAYFDAPAAAPPTGPPMRSLMGVGT